MENESKDTKDLIPDLEIEELLSVANGIAEGTIFTDRHIDDCSLISLVLYL